MRYLQLHYHSIESRKSLSEANNHINVLELLAAFLALQSFVSQSEIHVRLKLDNTTAVSYINNIGGMRSEPLNTLSKEIWQWCMTREIWLSAQYVPGVSNVEADSASRFFLRTLSGPYIQISSVNSSQPFGPLI